ncbi:MAG: tellurium resistance protein TerC [Verrucomicrobia bacterium]|nr:MAG: tellurium resistance protein TerC [Verrucomicrobiota bacterium]
MGILEIAMTLGMLVLLQAVLGFDNLLYISLESKHAPEERQSAVRKWGIGIAVGLRIVLLFLLITMIGAFQSTWFDLSWVGVIEGTFNLHSLIVLLGGVFIVYTAMKEIFHMIVVEDFHTEIKRESSSASSVIMKIVFMNAVFSFDSILSAIALVSDSSSNAVEPISSTNFWIMVVAIMTGGALMIWLADSVSTFLQRNRMYEVLGLFILFVVGILLLSEGGHLAHMKLFGQEILAMSKATFYFVITVLVLTEVVQSRYKRKLLQQQKSLRK